MKGLMSARETSCKWAFKKVVAIMRIHSYKEMNGKFSEKEKNKMKDEKKKVNEAEEEKTEEEIVELSEEELSDVAGGFIPIPY